MTTCTMRDLFPVLRFAKNELAWDGYAFYGLFNSLQDVCQLMTLSGTMVGLAEVVRESGIGECPRECCVGIVLCRN
jgi:hypothetical protein